LTWAIGFSTACFGAWAAIFWSLVDGRWTVMPWSVSLWLLVGYTAVLVVDRARDGLDKVLDAVQEWREEHPLWVKGAAILYVYCWPYQVIFRSLELPRWPWLESLLRYWPFRLLIGDDRPLVPRHQRRKLADAAGLAVWVASLGTLIASPWLLGLGPWWCAAAAAWLAAGVASFRLTGSGADIPFMAQNFDYALRGLGFAFFLLCLVLWPVWWGLCASNGRAWPRGR